eukprot:TRINITY_DN91583_c0_g1_i1.p1 TRINITY_DN91583_c0_g1~~TRINITY_DN91583_c0_g1_i1.p1  ORF type:complete len:381 (+),score=76.40 TRINITY_DN91583_c0_g1_i1:86-1228(+)
MFGAAVLGRADPIAGRSEETGRAHGAFPSHLLTSGPLPSYCAPPARGIFAISGILAAAALRQRRRHTVDMKAAPDPAAAAEAHRTGDKKLQFSTGDRIASARSFAATRFFAVAPWDSDVPRRPIFVISDTSRGGLPAAERLARRAFLQFGKTSLMDVRPALLAKTKEAITAFIDKEVVQAGSDKRGYAAFFVSAFLSCELSDFFLQQCQSRSIPCFDALETAVSTLERKFGKRSQAAKKNDDLDDDLLFSEESDLTVYAAADGSCELAISLARAALERVQGHKVKTIRACPNVHTLEEVDVIAHEAFRCNSVVLFSFASPGMSRFMRQQCERLKVVYADIFLPLVMEMEKYFDYPPVGMPGGLDLKEIDVSQVKMEEHPV